MCSIISTRRVHHNATSLVYSVGSAMIKTHTVSFYRYLDEPGESRAVCTCGWSMRGSLEECQTRAATHDLDEVEEAAEYKKPPFASGLSDY
jgi:hypothetical protein